MATSGGKNPAYETFRKHSADLLMVIQDPEVLAWELYSKDIITVDEREAACYHMHSRGMRTSSLLSAVESKIKVNPGTFDVFLSVLAKQPSMSDLCERMKDAYSKSNSGRQTSLDSVGILNIVRVVSYLVNHTWLPQNCYSFSPLALQVGGVYAISLLVPCISLWWKVVDGP